MKARRPVAVAVLALWCAGIGLIERREYFRPYIERVAEAAIRLSPGAVYYGVMRDGSSRGFASSSIDTALTEITATDYLVADIPIAGKWRRASARTKVVLSRTLRVRSFSVLIDADGPPLRAEGVVDGDSVLIVTVTSKGSAPDTQRIALHGPILLPTTIPLALSLGERPSVGKRYVLPVFDPIGMSAVDVTLSVRAESLFVLADSAVFDATTKRWRGTYPDTVRAWQIATEPTGGFTGWIDEQGRVVKTSQLGFELRRLPYQEAFGNWRLESAQRDSGGSRGVASANSDIYETTAIAANQLTSRKDIARLRVRLRGADLVGFQLDGDRQRLQHDTLLVEREAPSKLRATYYAGRNAPSEATNYLAAEPMLQVRAPEIVALARRLRGRDTDPATIARRINQWVHDSLAKAVTVGIPSAVDVLAARRGDCNEHTQLFVALARAAGIPARVVAGLAFINGKFYYHAWPEILLDGWIAVDPTFGEFPADAAHLRFVVGGLTRQTELLRLMGVLGIDVLDVQ